MTSDRHGYEPLYTGHLENSATSWVSQHVVGMADTDSDDTLRYTYAISRDGSLEISASRGMKRHREHWTMFKGKLLHSEWDRIAKVAAHIVECTDPSPEELAYHQRRDAEAADPERRERYSREQNAEIAANKARAAALGEEW